MKRRFFWVLLGVLIAIPLLPSIILTTGNIFSGIGVSKVDDWIYEEMSLNSILTIAWAHLGLGGKVIAIFAAVLFLVYIGFPLYKFAQGLISKGRWKKHRLWLGVPAVCVVFPALYCVGDVCF